MRRRQIEGSAEFDDTLGLREIEPGALTVPHGEVAQLQQLF